MREPLGVVAGITPPNYPLTMPLYKAAPALATGNTIIIKPSEDTSLVALRLGRAVPRSRPARGRVQRRHRLRRNRRRGARRSRRRRQDHLHRLDRSRPRAGPRLGGQLEKSLARTRRQIAEHRLRRRRSRSRAQGRVHGHLLLPGRDLLGGLAAVCRGIASTTTSSRASPTWRAP